jgi:hypothetical protein
MSVWNVSEFLQNYTALQPRTLYSLYSLVREPQIQHGFILLKNYYFCNV